MHKVLYWIIGDREIAGTEVCDIEDRKTSNLERHKAAVL
jgi:hypothetical protein